MIKLLHHQKDGLKYCLSVKNPILLWQQRLGKSIVSIYSELLKIPISKKVLIIAPNSSIYGWEQACHIFNQKFITLEGSTKEKRIILENNFHEKSIKFFIINKEFTRYLPEIAYYPYIWDTVILDEAQHIRNQNQFSKFMIENFRYARRYTLSGTLTPESDLEYYNPFKWSDYEIWRYKNYWSFKNKCFVWNKYNYTLTIKSFAKQLIANTIKTYASVIDAKDINLHIPVCETVCYTTLSKKLMTVYTSITETFSYTYKDLENSTIFAPVAYSWWRQLCGGFLDKQKVHDEKIKLLLEQEIFQTKNPCIILCSFRLEVQAIYQYLKEQKFSVDFIYGGITKKKRRYKFFQAQQNNTQFLICQHQAVSEGADLSHADTMIFYSLPESSLVYEQVKERFKNIKKKNNNKQIIYLFIKNTIEYRILELLKKKFSKQQIIKELAKGL
jgi:hypothetical protein